MEPEQNRVQGTALETVIVFTGQMEELARFYQEGLELGQFEHSPKHLGQKAGNVYLGFDQVDGTEGGARSGATLWFTVDDLQATFDRLVALGAEVNYPPVSKPWGALLASLFDPDGNLFGLSQRQP
jgi:uncharacterized glyoxalase superfamily protein PhnB